MLIRPALRRVACLLVLGFLAANASTTAAPASPDLRGLGQECAAGQSDACSRLRQAALDDPQWAVRRAAVEQIADQALLAEIVTRERVAQVRLAAAARLADRALAERV